MTPLSLLFLTVAMGAQAVAFLSLKRKPRRPVLGAVAAVVFVVSFGAALMID